MSFDFLTSTLLSTNNSILHGFTLRNPTKFPESVYNGFNLSYQVKDHSEVVTAHRTAIATSVFNDNRKVFFPVQTHSNIVKEVQHDTSLESLENCDALISNAPNVVIGILSADCVPILLFDTKNKAIAAIHAGWRGTAAKIVQETIKAMQHAYGTHAQHIFASIGPSISAEVYEVGEEVVKQMHPESIVQRSETSTCCDLWMENKIQLEESGVPTKNIDVLGVCTYKNPEQCFSARREGLYSGRMGAFIGLK
ncbi:MAG: peptidoglycan editing factor PgeF [Cytophagaceae bacterium]